MPKSDKKAAQGKPKNKVAKPVAPPPLPKLPATSKEILSKIKAQKKSNGKIPAPDQSSDESSDSSSEDDDAKRKMLSSRSAELSKVKKTSSAPAAKGKGKMESSDSSEPSSSEDSSADDVVMKNVQPVVDKKSSKPKVQAIKASIAKAPVSSDDSSDSSSEDEQPAKLAPTSKSSSDESSSEDSDDEDHTSAPSKAQVKSSDASSSDDSSSDEDDVKPANGQKRKPEVEPSVQSKKAKLSNDAAAPASADETKSIFVGRLSWNVDNDWLAQEFSSCGEVVSAHVQMDRATGRSRGFGYVHFASADAVEKALEMNGKEIDGRAVNVDKSTPPDKNNVRENRAKTFGDTASPASNVLFVGNLSFDVTEDQLWEVFGEHGDVKSVRVPTDRDSGRPKGFAYVEFTVLESAKTAHEQLQGCELSGRNIRLDYSQPRDNAGGGRGGGRGRGGFGGGGFGGGDRGRGGRGGFGGGDRGRGGFGDRGGRGRGRGGDRGGRGGGRGRGGPRTGAVAQFEGSKITFD